MIRWGTWTAYVVVFVASACALILEIAAARLLAPYLGVSLYTWTSIIGVVLAGIALGNYLGGLVADMAGSRRTLGLLLAAAGAASLAILPFTTTDLVALAPRGSRSSSGSCCSPGSCSSCRVRSWGWCRRSW